MYKSAVGTEKESQYSRISNYFSYRAIVTKYLLQARWFRLSFTLGAETFAARNFREKKNSRNEGHKLSRMTFFPANFTTKTFAIEEKDS